MKIIILFFAFFFLVKFTIAQGKITDLAEKPLKGHVKEVIVEIYRGRQNDSAVDLSKLSEKIVRRFDIKGNETEQFGYSANGTLNFKITFNYVNDSTVITSQINGADKLMVKNTYIYDAKGNEIESNPDFGGRIQSAVSKFIYKYDENRNRVEEDTYGTDGKIIGVNLLLYNKQNQLIETDQKGFYINNSTKYFYDSLGNEIKIETYDKNGKLSSANTSLYKDIDKNGNWLFSIAEYKGHSQWQGDFVFKNATKRTILYY